MSYQSYTVDIPQVTGKITYRTVKNTKYVYYEYDRTYDPVTQLQEKSIGDIEVWK